MVNLSVESIVKHQNHIPLLTEWLSSYWQERLDKVPTYGTVLDDKAARRSILESHGEALPTSLLAFVNAGYAGGNKREACNVPVGMVSLVRYQSQGELDESVWLTNLYVEQAYRGQGIGERLLDDARAHVATLNASGKIKSFNGLIKLICHEQKAFYLERGWMCSERRLQPQGFEMLTHV